MVSFEEFVKDHRFIRKKNVKKNDYHDMFLSEKKAKELGITLENIDEHWKYRLATDEEIRKTFNKVVANHRVFTTNYHKSIRDLGYVESCLEIYGNVYICEFDDFVKDYVDKLGYKYEVKECKNNGGYVIWKK